jgi:hypothetical protein
LSVSGSSPAAARQTDRVADVVGIAFDHAAHHVGVGELFGLFGQMHDHVGADVGALGLFDGEAALAVAVPAPGGVGMDLAGQHLDALGDHEGGIEPDAELADQRGVGRAFLLLLGVGALGLGLGGLLRLKRLDERLRAGARDGAQRFDQVVLVHADAVVRHRDRLGLVIDGDGDGEARLAGAGGLVGDGGVAAFVAGVGGVGDQLAQEHLALAVERARDDIEQLADLGLEGEGFFCHGVPPKRSRKAPDICGCRAPGASPRALSNAPPPWNTGPP